MTQSTLSRVLTATALTAVLALSPPAFASAGGEPTSPTPRSCSSSQGVRVIPLEEKAVDLRPTPATALTDGDIAEGLRKAGASPRAQDVLRPIIRDVAQHLSGGNPNAVEVGEGITPSSPRGAMLLTPYTFSTNHVEGTSNNINNPVASVAASVTYAAIIYCVDLGTGAGAEKIRAAARG